MKKILMFVCMFVVMFGIVGCGNSTQDTQTRMELRVDKADAAQIGKAVKIWDLECNNDPAFKSEVENSGSVLSTVWTRASDLGKIDEFVYINNGNLVLEGADYYVAKTSDESYKIVVGISNNNGTDLIDPKDVTEIDDYDGTSSAVVWLEPDSEM